MSIITDLKKYRNFKCGVCGTKETYFDKTNRVMKWYKTLVKEDKGFWCYNCYQSIHRQIRVRGEL